jgi:hypothetical protein
LLKEAKPEKVQFDEGKEFYNKYLKVGSSLVSELISRPRSYKMVIKTMLLYFGNYSI